LTKLLYVIHITIKVGLSPYWFEFQRHANLLLLIDSDDFCFSIYICKVLIIILMCMTHFAYLNEFDILMFKEILNVCEVYLRFRIKGKSIMHPLIFTECMM